MDCHLTRLLRLDEFQAQNMSNLSFGNSNLLVRCIMLASSDLFSPHTCESVCVIILDAVAALNGGCATIMYKDVNAMQSLAAYASKHVSAFQTQAALTCG
eukprot:2337286-Amphidinium_carterae.1